MTRNVSRFGPQIWNIALNREHWGTRSLEKPLPTWLFPSISCKLEGEKEKLALPLLGAFGRMPSHEYPVFAAERNRNLCQHPKNSNPPSIRLLLVLLSGIW